MTTMVSATRTALWRAMTQEDLPEVHDVSGEVHPGYPERPEVFAERLRLYPEGCHVLETDDGIGGYIISHPWHPFSPPKLDTLVVAMPTLPATYYIHDLALLPGTRGTGAAGYIVRKLADHAAAIGLRDMSLVAVNASTPFWERQGFNVLDDARVTAALSSYDADARFLMRMLPET